MADAEQPDLTTLTVNLLSAYFANNIVESGTLPAMIQSTHSALRAINAPVPAEPAVTEFVPAVSVRKSLASTQHIISLIDGKPYKTLKRHLKSHGLTPAEYRDRYKLPPTYPMVAPDFAEQRRAIANRLGLGRKIAISADVETAVDEPIAVAPTPVADVKPAGQAAGRTGKAKPAAMVKAPRSKSKAIPADGPAETSVSGMETLAPVKARRSGQMAVASAEVARTQAAPLAIKAKRAKASVAEVPAEAKAEETAKPITARKAKKATPAPVAVASPAEKEPSIKPKGRRKLTANFGTTS